MSAVLLRDNLAKQELVAKAQGCAARGWAWIHENLPLFMPADPLDPEQLQKLAELALLYGCTISWSGEYTRAELRSTEQFLLNFVADSAVAEYARRQLTHFNPYFVAYLALRQLGYRSDAYEEALLAARRAGYPRALEATPYRELEIMHLMWKAGLRQRRPVCGRIYSGTVLARCRNPIYLDTAYVYSITHTIFYLNDFCGPPEVIPSPEVRRAAELVESLLVHYWRKKDWDLVSELALNLLSLDQCNTPLFCQVVRALLEAWRSQSDGALPGPTFQPGGSEPEPDYRFKHCYHTTVVGTLFCEAYHHRRRLDAG